MSRAFITWLGGSTLLCVLSSGCGEPGPGPEARSVEEDGGIQAPALDASPRPDSMRDLPPVPQDAPREDVAPDSAVPVVTDAVTDPQDAVSGDGAQPDSGPPPLPPPGFPMGAAGKLEMGKSLQGPVTRTRIDFSVYTPPGYEGGTDRYPVVYYLHGAAGNRPEVITAFRNTIEEAMRRSRSGPMILVFPAPPSGHNLWRGTVESQVIRDLLPWIDQNYRTIPHRARRALIGFSAGGYGAMNFAAKFPELFSVAVNVDGAVQAAGGEGGADSPWQNMTRNAATIRSMGLAIRGIVGEFEGPNRAFRDHLRELNIPYEYLETRCVHFILDCIWPREGLNTWEFVYQKLGRAERARVVKAGCAAHGEEATGGKAEGNEGARPGIFVDGRGSLPCPWQRMAAAVVQARVAGRGPGAGGLCDRGWRHQRSTRSRP